MINTGAAITYSYPFVSCTLNLTIIQILHVNILLPFK
jgi:hypothetical protein